MLQKEKTLCFSGHRSEKLYQSVTDIAELRTQIYTEIENAVDDGYNTFIFGACYGFDLLCAEIVLLAKMVKQRSSNPMRLIAVIPFEEQPDGWGETDRNHYSHILGKCDQIVAVSATYTHDCYHKCNNYMVDHSSRLVCYYDGNSGGTAYTVKYAQQKNIMVINLYQSSVSR